MPWFENLFVPQAKGNALVVLLCSPDAYVLAITSVFNNRIPDDDGEISGSADALATEGIHDLIAIQLPLVFT